MKIPHKILSSGLSAILGLCLAAGAGAEIYKWVDEDGNVVYSENPPAGDTQVETITESPKVRSEKALQSLRNLKIKNQKTDRAKEEQVEARQQTAEEKRVRAENCGRAREMLASFNTRPTVQLVQPDGSRVRATEEQRQQRIAEAQSMIDEFCGE